MRQPEQATFRDLYAQAGGAARFQALIASRESAAKRIAIYEIAIIPGILQTPQYAKEMLHLPGGPACHGASEDDIRRMITARIQRQALLHEPGRDITVLLSEAALRNQLASPAAMQQQREHIAQLAETLTTAAIGVIAFTQAPVIALNGWWLTGNQVTIETAEREVYITDPAEAERYWQRTQLLLSAAATGSEAAEFCRSMGRSASRLIT